MFDRVLEWLGWMPTIKKEEPFVSEFLYHNIHGFWIKLDDQESTDHITGCMICKDVKEIAWGSAPFGIGRCRGSSAFKEHKYDVFTDGIEITGVLKELILLFKPTALAAQQVVIKMDEISRSKQQLERDYKTACIKESTYHECLNELEQQLTSLETKMEEYVQKAQDFYETVCREKLILQPESDWSLANNYVVTIKNLDEHLVEVNKIIQSFKSLHGES